MLWTFDDLVSAMRATPFLPGEAPQGVSGISIDTRTLEPGEAYFAIRGDTHDGHDFVDAAREAGAACAVVSREKAKAAGSLPILIVEDVLEALADLGRAARARTDALIVAVTGSVGKTTTKELLRTMLAPSGRVHAAVASFNNHWGVPLTLARMPADTDYAVIEIGMNHPGEITPLVRMARPHVAVITLVAGAHMGAFKSIDEIALAKAEIFEGLDANGVAVLNAADPRLPILRAEAERRGIVRIVTFGQTHARGDGEARADVKLAHYNPRRSTLDFEVVGRAMSARMGAPGLHVANNAVAAFAVVFLFGADLTAATTALATFEAGKGRGERHTIARADGAVTLIDESYNANPASMRAAIQALWQTVPEEGGRRIAVLGDMLELGRHSAAAHERLAQPLSRFVDAAWLVGPEMLPLAHALRPDAEFDVETGRPKSATQERDTGPADVRWFETTPQLATIIADEVRGHDVVVVKSSLGLRFATLVEALTAPPAVPQAHATVPEGTEEEG